MKPLFYLTGKISQQDKKAPLRIALRRRGRGCSHIPTQAENALKAWSFLLETDHILFSKLVKAVFPCPGMEKNQ